MDEKVRNIIHTLKNDLCTGCGVCVGACLSQAISMTVKEGRFVPQIDSLKCKNDKGCHRCYDACPGLGVDLQQLAINHFDDESKKVDDIIGCFLKCFTGYSNDNEIRYHSASGGLVSAFLIWLLEKNHIDGAVVTAFDNSNPLMVRSYIAKTKEEILAAKSSKYAPVSLHNITAEIKKAEGHRFVIVGLPCHIEGFRKLADIDSKFREKIAGYFGIYCSSGRTFYLTEHVMKAHKINRDNLEYFAYRDNGCLGDLVAVRKENFHTSNNVGMVSKSLISIPYQQYYHPLRSFFIPKRCLFCVDHFNELADISFGDIHVDPYIQDKVGISSLVARNQKWLKLLIEAKKTGAITLDEITEDVLKSSQGMAFKKKGRNARFMAINKILGRRVPQYDCKLPAKFGLKDVIDWLQNRVQQFLGRHKCLWWLVTLLKKDTSDLK